MRRPFTGAESSRMGLLFFSLLLSPWLS